MPGRSHLLVTGNYYHVFNKTIDAKRPFEESRMLRKFREIAWYYRSCGGHTPLAGTHLRGVYDFLIDTKA